MQKCVLAGYYGFGNAGDELILQSILANIQSVEWIVLSHDPESTKRRHCVNAVNRWNFISVTKALRHSGKLVMGGGELFQVRTSTLSLLYYLVLGFWAQMIGCAVYMFAVGIDPNMPAWTKSLVVFLFRRCRYNGVRDLQTANIIKMGKLKNIQVMADPVWARPVSSYTKPKKLNRILWILRPLTKDPKEIIPWASHLNKLSNSMRLEHGFMVFHPHQDDAFISDLRGLLDFFHTLERWKSLDDIYGVVGRYDLVVSMRFHGVIISRICRRPCLAVTGHPKVAQIAELLGNYSLKSNMIDELALERSIHQVWKGHLGGKIATIPDLSGNALTAMGDMSHILIQ